VLTGHSSLNTVQGYEWLGKDAWVQQAVRNESLQACVRATPDCVRDWTEDWNIVSAWLYLPRATIESISPNGDCCAGLRAALATSPDYEVVNDGAGGTVFRPRSTP
jgi:hypothetical protein